ncbi:MAG: hypothetical protein ACHQ2Z_11835 [Elusimicrobiota bacterium]
MHFLLNAVALSVIVWTLFRFVLRGALRAVLVRLGKNALDKQPDRIRLDRLASPAWRDAAKMAAQAEPLLALGFEECGSYTPDKMPGVKLRILLKEDSRVAAFIYEHPKAGVWTELSVRYEDGATTACVNRAATGLQPPPFFRKILGDPAEPTDRLYARLIQERPGNGIKLVSKATVVPEYEDAWMRIMIWQKNKGLSAEEVAAVAQKHLEKRKAPESGRPG